MLKVIIIIYLDNVSLLVAVLKISLIKFGPLLNDSALPYTLDSLLGILQNLLQFPIYNKSALELLEIIMIFTPQ